MSFFSLCQSSSAVAVQDAATSEPMPERQRSSRRGGLFRRFTSRSGNKKALHFGTPLEEMQCDTRTNVPTVVVRMVEYMRTTGLQVEGLFRRSVGQSSLQKIKAGIERGQALSKIADCTPLAVSQLLKQFLREVPHGIVSTDIKMALHMERVRMARSTRTFDLNTPNSGTLEGYQQIQEVLGQLPPRNLALLGYLATFLNECSTFESATRMGVRNLATMMGPNIFEEMGQSSLEESMTDMGIMNELMLLFIVHYDCIFIDYDADHATPPLQASSSSVTAMRRSRTDLSLDDAFDEPQDSDRLRGSGVTFATDAEDDNSDTADTEDEDDGLSAEQLSKLQAQFLGLNSNTQSTGQQQTQQQIQHRQVPDGALHKTTPIHVQVKTAPALPSPPATSPTDQPQLVDADSMEIPGSLVGHGLIAIGEGIRPRSRGGSPSASKRRGSSPSGLAFFGSHPVVSVTSTTPGGSPSPSPQSSLTASSTRHAHAEALLATCITSCFFGNGFDHFGAFLTTTASSSPSQQQPTTTIPLPERSVTTTTTSAKNGHHPSLPDLTAKAPSLSQEERVARHKQQAKWLEPGLVDPTYVVTHKLALDVPHLQADRLSGPQADYLIRCCKELAKMVKRFDDEFEAAHSRRPHKKERKPVAHFVAEYKRIKAWLLENNYIHSRSGTTDSSSSSQKKKQSRLSIGQGTSGSSDNGAAQQEVVVEKQEHEKDGKKQSDTHSSASSTQGALSVTLPPLPKDTRSPVKLLALSNNGDQPDADAVMLESSLSLMVAPVLASRKNKTRRKVVVEDSPVTSDVQSSDKARSVSTSVPSHVPKQRTKEVASAPTAATHDLEASELFSKPPKAPTLNLNEQQVGQQAPEKSSDVKVMHEQEPSDRQRSAQHAKVDAVPAFVAPTKKHHTHPPASPSPILTPDPPFTDGALNFSSQPKQRSAPSPTKAADEAFSGCAATTDSPMSDVLQNHLRVYKEFKQQGGSELASEGAALQREKQLLHKVLRSFESDHEAKFQRKPSKSERKPLQTYYKRYRQVKDALSAAQGEGDSKAPPTHSNSQPAEIASAVGAVTMQFSKASSPSATPAVDGAMVPPEPSEVLVQSHGSGNAMSSTDESQSHEEIADGKKAVTVTVTDMSHDQLLERKGAVNKQLRKFQNQFFELHGHAPSTPKERKPAAKLYAEYKTIKQLLRAGESTA
eukprot:m.63496 g.63496  ORF g.63496 m.63496 type:complete len:1190 (+) comp11950_c0_seq3:258-3827(+)